MLISNLTKVFVLKKFFDDNKLGVFINILLIFINAF